MKITAIFMALLMGLCLFSACGTEQKTSSDSATEPVSTMETEKVGAESAAKTTTKALAKKNTSVSFRGTVVTLPEPEITAVSLTYSGDSPITLDLEEKSGTFAAHVEASGYVKKEHIRIYAEDASLVEISDITIKEDGLINFYLTGKKAGSSNLYIATTDGKLVSEPQAFYVRSETEREKAERPVYYCVLGDYWHFSEECAKTDVPDTGYDMNRRRISREKWGFPIIEVSQQMIPSRISPCPKCAAEQAAQQDGE